MSYSKSRPRISGAYGRGDPVGRDYPRAPPGDRGYGHSAGQTSYRGERDRGRGRGRGGRHSGGAQRGGPDRKVCQYYKFTGECPFGDRCRDHHLRPRMRERHECSVPIPEKLPVAVVAGRNWCNLRLVMDAVDCAVVLSKINARELRIVADNEKSLQKAKETLELQLAPLFPISPMWLYLHVEGASEISESLLVFEQYKGRNPGNFYGVNRGKPLYQVCISDHKTNKAQDLRRLGPSSQGPSKLKPEVVLDKTLSDLYGPGASPKNPDDVLQSMKDDYSRVKIITNHSEDIQQKLFDALKWLAEKFIPAQDCDCTAKLEARFGKVVWTEVPEDFLANDEGMTVEEFSALVFDKYHRRAFNTDVQRRNADVMCAELQDSKGVAVESFDLVFTADGEQVNVRIRILENGEQKVLLVKKSEQKIALFDIICFHRQHDIRISLSCVTVVPHDPGDKVFGIVQKLLTTIHYSVQDQTLSYVPRDINWALSFIRHKVRTPHIIDDKYVVTVSHIQEQEVNWRVFNCGDSLSTTLDKFQKEHIEVEFHNARWVTAFGGNARLSPEESLERMLHMDRSDITPELTAHTPHPWTVESIAEDFEEFLGHSESLNETLGEVAI